MISTPGPLKKREKSVSVLSVSKRGEAGAEDAMKIESAMDMAAAEICFMVLKLLS